MSLLGNIAAFKTGTYTVTRTAAGTRALGIYTPGATSTFNIDADMQPYRGERGGLETMPLPEGYRAENMRTLYTTTELYPVSQTGVADTISIDSETWEVFKVQSWIVPWLSDSYYKVTIARQERP